MIVIQVNWTLIKFKQKHMVNVILSYQVGRQWKVGTMYLDFVSGGGIKGGKPDKINFLPSKKVNKREKIKQESLATFIPMVSR